MLTRLSLLIVTALGVGLVMTSCKPEGYINTVKYDGKKVVNTCTSFSEEASRVIEGNRNGDQLVVARGDNSDRDYYFLEKGQFEVKNDSLLFRLNRDFEFRNYLDKGVAIHANVAYQTPEAIRDLEASVEGSLGTIVVTREFYVANNKPEFIYKLPLNGQPIAGKQILLSFAIAKYTGAGALKKYFCETESAPIGVASPACCTATPWTEVKLQSIYDYPKLMVEDESYKYKGFVGTLDVLFPESSFSIPDTIMAPLMIQAFVDKFKKFGYDINTIDLTGYASPGGKEPYNNKLSEERAQAILKRLEFLKAEYPALTITAVGKGEDWDRVKAYTKASSLTAEQKAEVLAIASEPINNDEKEAKLRKVTFWPTLVEEVLIKARHTYTVHDYGYSGQEATIDRYAESLPLHSRQLEQIAGSTIKVSAYKPGINVSEQTTRINDLLTRKATSNLYAMRASYFIAQNNLDKAEADLESAQKISNKGDDYYTRVARGIRLERLDSYSIEQRKDLYRDYSELTRNNPGDRALFYNRVVILEKTGALSSTLKEYDALMEGTTPEAAQLNNRGVAHLEANMVTAAIADFQAAVLKNPTVAEAHYNLAVAYAWKGLSRMAVTSLENAVKLKPELKAAAMVNPAFSVIATTPLFDTFRN